MQQKMKHVGGKLMNDFMLDFAENFMGIPVIKGFKI
jgi:hypothetical protein